MATTIQTGRGNSPLLTANIADHGTIYGGRGLIFDGVTDYLTGSIPTTYSGLSNWSMSWWSKAVAYGDYDRIATFDGGGTKVGYRTTGKITFWFDGSNNIDFTGTAQSTGVWYHNVITFDKSSTTVKHYLNGALDYTKTDVTDTTLDAGGAYTIGAWSTLLFDGTLSDIKVFNATLTEAHAQELYLKPEQSAPSSVRDNIFFWLPMCEGNPDSPQSIVYDHSEKKLSTVYLRDFSGVADGSDPILLSYIDSYNSPAERIIDNERIKIVDSDNSGVTWVSESGLTASKLYKITIEATGDVAIGGVYSSGNSIVFTLSNGTFTGYKTGITETGVINLRANDNSSGTTYYDNLKIEEVLMGNHATTVFYGGDLFDANRGSFTNDSNELRTGSEIATGALTHHKWYQITARDGIDFTAYGAPNNTVGTTFCLNHPDGSSVPTMDSNDKVFLINLNWIPYNDNTMYLDSNTSLKVTRVDQNNGANLTLDDANDLSSDLTVGKTYQLSFNAKVGSSESVTATSNGTNISTATVTATTFTAYTIKFVCTSTSNVMVFDDMTGTEKIWIDALTLKEVGVSSSGFATAQEEPTIPQVPLLRYNEKMVFDGVDDKVSLDSTLTISSSGGQGSISAVVNIVKDATYRMIIGGVHPNLFAYMGYYDANFKWLIDGAWNTSSTAIVTGKTYHIIGTWNDTSYKFYVNGVLDWSITDAAMVADMHTIGDSPNYEETMGIIDEVSAWNTELSATEVAELFADGVALDATTHSKVANLVGYWRNNGISSWTDRSTNSNDGTPAGTPESIIVREGLNSNKDGLGFPFNNADRDVLRTTENQYVKVAFAESMRPSADFTIEYWMKTVNNQTAGHMFYVGQDGTEGRAFSDISSNKLRFGVRLSNNVSTEVMMEAVHNTDSAYNDDNWHHIVHVCDVENTKLKIYADGKKIFQDAFTDLDGDYISTCVPFLSTTEPLFIGHRSGATGFTGLIDEFRWYTRKLTDALTGGDHTTDGNALTVTVGGEILKNYKHGKGKHKN
jgi:hypothetical protein